MRLDQYISQAHGVSRTVAKKLIRQQRVTIAGQICTDNSYHVPAQQTVSLDEQQLELPGESYFILHKPVDYVCSHEDDGYPSALRLLPASRKKLHFAGRLDASSSGLVLISSDGAWCHRVSHPGKYKHSKYYQVQLAEPLTAECISRLEQGIELQGEAKPCQPCHIERHDDYHCTVVLHEGKYHQIRRMFAACGNRVIKLHRFRIGQLQLHGELLKAGSWRELQKNEVKGFE